MTQDTTWRPSTSFLWYVQVQICIMLWRDCGFGEPPDWLRDQLASARAANDFETIRRSWSKQVEAVE